MHLVVHSQRENALQTCIVWCAHNDSTSPSRVHECARALSRDLAVLVLVDMSPSYLNDLGQGRYLISLSWFKVTT